MGAVLFREEDRVGVDALAGVEDCPGLRDRGWPQAQAGLAEVARVPGRAGSGGGAGCDGAARSSARSKTSTTASAERARRGDRGQAPAARREPVVAALTSRPPSGRRGRCRRRSRRARGGEVGVHAGGLCDDRGLDEAAERCRGGRPRGARRAQPAAASATWTIARPAACGARAPSPAEIARGDLVAGVEQRQEAAARPAGRRRAPCARAGRERARGARARRASARGRSRRSAGRRRRPAPRRGRRWRGGGARERAAPMDREFH